MSNRKTLLELNDPFDETAELTTRHVLRRRTSDHPLERIFEAKRVNDLERRKAFRAIADWTTDRVALADAEKQLRRWQSNIDDLVAALKATEHRVEKVSDRPPNRPLAMKGHETE